MTSVPENEYKLDTTSARYFVKKIPVEFRLKGIHNTDNGIPLKLCKNSVPTEYEIPHYEILQNTEFRNILNSVLRKSAEYGIPEDGTLYDGIPRNTEFRQNVQNSTRIYGVPPEVTEFRQN